ncbi:MAG: helix-turn-helix transcriptional regulator [Bacteroidetes bacterium]|nr:helix-turn-helix transcriptional regulator [Bacteroidota bacterium]
MGRYSINKLPSEVLLNTSTKVRELRKEAGYSQAELARRSGVSLGSIKRFENTGQISMVSFLKILHLLNRLEEFDSILQAGETLEEIETLFTNK